MTLLGRLLYGSASGVDQLSADAGGWSAPRPIALLEEDLLAVFHEVLGLSHRLNSGFGYDE